MKRIVFVCGALMATVFNSSAQDAFKSIKGMVVTAQGKPVADAKVALYDTPIGGEKTDETGSFQFRVPPNTLVYLKITVGPEINLIKVNPADKVIKLTWSDAAAKTTRAYMVEARDKKIYDPDRVVNLYVEDKYKRDNASGFPDIRIDEAIDPPKEAYDPNKIYSQPTKMPEFVGGMTAFFDYIKKNMKYPAQAKQNEVQGKVFATFVIEKDGSITNIKVVREPGLGCGDEAARLLKNSPKWKPGYWYDKPVRTSYTVPITFKL